MAFTNCSNTAKKRVKFKHKKEDNIKRHLQQIQNCQQKIIDKT